jgi:arginine/lysine/ornithine decarboxylase
MKAWTSKQWLKAAKKEHDKFKRTGNPMFFAESGEKLWNAIGLYVDEKTGKSIESYYELKRAVANDTVLSQKLSEAYNLHTFFYRGRTDNRRNEEEDWKNVYNFLKRNKLKETGI